MSDFFRDAAQHVLGDLVDADDPALAQFARQQLRRIRRPAQTNLDTVLADLADRGWHPGLTRESYARVAACGFRPSTLPLACVAINILCHDQPMTLRGQFYRVVSAGWLPSTDKQHYATLGRLMTTLREHGVVPFEWLVDNVRQTDKPSSWSGLADFADDVQAAYRLDFWASLPSYIHVFCEKDAMAGVLQFITRRYDVSLSVIRGYVSLSFAHGIAAQWQAITKPITAYYLGDFDPSGLNLEADLRAKLTRYCDRPFRWERLAVTPEQFDEFGLYELAPKEADRRTRAFRAAGYTRCAELDAIPAPALRQRLEAAIRAHIPEDQWERLRQVEGAERESWQRIMQTFRSNGGAG